MSEALRLSEEQEITRYLYFIFMFLALHSANLKEFGEATSLLERARKNIDTEPSSAVASLEKSLDQFKKTNAPVEVAKTRLYLGEALVQRNQPGDKAWAKEVLDGALITYCDIQSEYYQASVLETLTGLST